MTQTAKPANKPSIIKKVLGQHANYQNNRTSKYQ
jgi:hypothetical protein